MRSLLDAVQNGSLSDVIGAINKGANVDERNSNGATPLILAANRGMTGMVDLLIENDAKMNVKTHGGSNAFFFAVKRDFNGIAHRLAAEGADVDTPNTNNTRALHWAAYNDSPDLIQLILNNGGRPSISRKDSKGNTPLHYAAQSNGIEAIQVLQANGAPNIIKNNNGRTAYDEANMRGYAAAAALLA